MPISPIRCSGPRLILCTRTVLAVEGRSLHVIFGSPDDMKFCFSMTLFSLAADEGDSVFQQALDDLDLYQVMRAAGQIETILGLSLTTKYDKSKLRTTG